MKPGMLMKTSGVSRTDILDFSKIVAGKLELDLVLMDVQMLGLDGFEVTRALREKEKITGNHLRIVAMTPYSMQGDRERCLAAGMDAYIAKPIHVKELIQAIEVVTG